METVTISKKEYSDLKKKAKMNEGLLLQLVRGIDDIKSGRVVELKKSKSL